MTKSISPYPPEIMKLQSIEGFAQAFEDMGGGQHGQREEKYEELEGVYEHYYGRRRFSCYHAFLVARRNYKSKKDNS